MNNSKEAILSRIRAAVANSPSAPPIPREYRQEAPADLELFVDRLTDYGVHVHRCREEELRQAVAVVLTQANKNSVLIAGGFPPELLPSGFRFEIDQRLSYEELNQAEAVLTGCALAIAETGTIVLRHTESEGRRALTLIPDYHLCIVRAQDVVATVPQALRLMADFPHVPITTISGPSATSDIEMTRVKGVHGPRTLDVILSL